MLLGLSVLASIDRCQHEVLTGTFVFADPNIRLFSGTKTGHILKLSVFRDVCHESLDLVAFSRNVPNKIQSTYTVRDVSAYPYRGSLRYITKDDVIHPCRG